MKNKSVIKKQQFPLIDKLVDTLDTPELNELIEEHTENNQERQILFMFINIYLYIKLNSSGVNKEQMKELITEIIKDHNKRKFCIDTFFNFQKNIESEITTTQLKLTN